MSFQYLKAAELTQEQLIIFERYREFLLDWNRKVNLTAITDPGEVEVKHFLDSLLLRSSEIWKKSSGMETQPMQVVDVGGEKEALPTQIVYIGSEMETQPMRVVDVGGGAGFPGIPLKIVHGHIALDTLEASRKKVDFLQALTEDLTLEDTRAIHIRAEEAGQDPAFREKYDWALVRGVAAMPTLLEYCLPLLKMGGYMAAYKGPSGRKEAETAKKAAATMGGRLVDSVNASLPEGQGERQILIYRKVKATPKKYPRKPGFPAKQPIL
ncbi:MAG: 16S rRNA (guanine(527)-N(7))-methyltransferase RsmG [Peptococcaceae bacterium]|nr:16S rRNA (guanine(527)-N(7))-methyltransferase RsmG [Peptococcaceae bacterium]